MVTWQEWKQAKQLLTDGDTLNVKLVNIDSDFPLVYDGKTFRLEGGGNTIELNEEKGTLINSDKEYVIESVDYKRGGAKETVDGATATPPTADGATPPTPPSLAVTPSAATAADGATPPTPPFTPSAADDAITTTPPSDDKPDKSDLEVDNDTPNVAAAVAAAAVIATDSDKVDAVDNDTPNATAKAVAAAAAASAVVAADSDKDAAHPDDPIRTGTIQQELRQVTFTGIERIAFVNSTQELVKDFIKGQQTAELFSDNPLKETKTTVYTSFLDLFIRTLRNPVDIVVNCDPTPDLPYLLLLKFLNTDRYKELKLYHFEDAKFQPITVSNYFDKKKEFLLKSGKSLVNVALILELLDTVTSSIQTMVNTTKEIINERSDFQKCAILFKAYASAYDMLIKDVKKYKVDKNVVILGKVIDMFGKIKDVLSVLVQMRNPDVKPHLVDVGVNGGELVKDKLTPKDFEMYQSLVEFSFPAKDKPKRQLNISWQANKEKFNQLLTDFTGSLAISETTCKEAFQKDENVIFIRNMFFLYNHIYQFTTDPQTKTHLESLPWIFVDDILDTKPTNFHMIYHDTGDATAVVSLLDEARLKLEKVDYKDLCRYVVGEKVEEDMFKKLTAITDKVRSIASELAIKQFDKSDDVFVRFRINLLAQYLLVGKETENLWKHLVSAEEPAGGAQTIQDNIMLNKNKSLVINDEWVSSFFEEPGTIDLVCKTTSTPPKITVKEINGVIYLELEMNKDIVFRIYTKNSKPDNVELSYKMKQGDTFDDNDIPSTNLLLINTLNCLKESQLDDLCSPTNANIAVAVAAVAAVDEASDVGEGGAADTPGNEDLCSSEHEVIQKLIQAVKKAKSLDITEKKEVKASATETNFCFRGFVNPIDCYKFAKEELKFLPDSIEDETKMKYVTYVYRTLAKFKKQFSDVQGKFTGEKYFTQEFADVVHDEYKSVLSNKKGKDSSQVSDSYYNSVTEAYYYLYSKYVPTQTTDTLLMPKGKFDRNDDKNAKLLVAIGTYFLANMEKLTVEQISSFGVANATSVGGAGINPNANPSTPIEPETTSTIAPPPVPNPNPSTPVEPETTSANVAQTPETTSNEINYQKLRKQIYTNIDLFINKFAPYKLTAPTRGKLINIHIEMQKDWKVLNTVYKHFQMYIVPNYYLTPNTTKSDIFQKTQKTTKYPLQTDTIVAIINNAFKTTTRQEEACEKILKCLMDEFKEKCNSKEIKIVNHNDFEVIKAIAEFDDDSFPKEISSSCKIITKNVQQYNDAMLNLLMKPYGTYIGQWQSESPKTLAEFRISNILKTDLSYLALIFAENCSLFQDGNAKKLTLLNKLFDANSAKTSISIKKKIQDNLDILNKNSTTLIKTIEDITAKFISSTNQDTLTEFSTYKEFIDAAPDVNKLKAVTESKLKNDNLLEYKYIFDNSKLEDIVKPFSLKHSQSVGGASFLPFKKNDIPNLSSWIHVSDDIATSIKNIHKNGAEKLVLDTIVVDDDLHEFLFFNENVGKFVGDHKILEQSGASAATSKMKDRIIDMLSKDDLKQFGKYKIEKETLLKSPSQDKQTEEKEPKTSLFNSMKGIFKKDKDAEIDEKQKKVNEARTLLTGQVGDIIKQRLKDNAAVTVGPTPAQFDARNKAIEALTAAVKIDPKNIHSTIEPIKAAPCKAASGCDGPLASLLPRGSHKDHSPKITKYLDKYEAFVQFIEDKNLKWLQEASTACADTKLNINQTDAVLDSSKYENKDKPPTRGEKNAAINRRYLYHRKMLDMYKNKLTVNYQHNKNYFLKEFRKSYAAIRQYLANNAILKNEEYRKQYEIPDELKKSYEAIEERFTKCSQRLDVSNQSFYTALQQSFKQCNNLDTQKYFEKEHKEDLDMRSEVVTLMFLHNIDKLKSLYNVNYSLMELIFDSQFFVMYVIKGIRILFTYIALFLTTRVFSPMYEDAVYDQKANPPTLARFLLIFFAFDASFNVFLLVLLYLLKFLFKSDENAFVVDQYLFNKYITDYVISMVILLLVGYMISRVMMEKKYFKYRYEGLRAIRAYESIMFNVAIVIYIIPFFMMV